jgi:methyltransferase-like protein
MSADMPNPYDEVPYESHAYAASTPDRLALMAILFGMEPAPPERCRVLEIGCGSGGNIGPLAWLCPESTFVGFDLSRVQIEEGKRFLEPFGLENIELMQLDLMDVDERFGTFDYIICHGVYSWVPNRVRDRILALCRDHLAPRGVAYVSYNTYPGWHMRGMIRDMMLFHTADFADPQQKVTQARALLEFLAEAHPQESQHPYAMLLRREAKRLRELPFDYLVHDYLEEHNAPVYFHEFVQRAQAHNLAYLGESSFRSMLPSRLPPHVQEILSHIGTDLFKTEQYMDFVINCSFRSSLVVHEDQRIERSIEWRTMTRFHFGCDGRFAVDPGDLVSEVPVDVMRDVHRMTVYTPLLKAAFRVLIDAWPRSVSFEDLLRDARALISSTENEEEDRPLLGDALLNGLANDIVEVRVSPVRAGRLTERPTVFPWARAQVADGASRLTDLRHECGPSGDSIRSILHLLDGTRDGEQVVEELLRQAREGRVALRSPDGELVEDADELRRVFTDAVEATLEIAERSSMILR